MPLFNAGTILARRRAEDNSTPGSQKNSLTFVDRGAPRPKYTGETGQTPMGLLLTGHTGSFFEPGATRRFATRSTMGNGTGWEFDKAVAISGNQATVDLLYNPNLKLHRDLGRVNLLDEFYRVVTFARPPHMFCVAGEVQHVSAVGGGYTEEASETVTVTVKNQWGAVQPVDGMVWQLQEAQSGGVYKMEYIGGRQVESISTTATMDLTVASDTFTFAHGGTAALTDKQATLLVVVPGVGFAVSADVAGDFATSVSVTDGELEAALLADASLPVYVGLYVDDSGDKLLYR